MVSASTRTVGGTAPTISEMFAEHFDFVWRMVVHFGVRGADVDDVVQDVFMVAVRRIADFDPSRPMRPWLGAISFNCVRDHRRQKARVVANVDPAAMSEVDAAIDESDVNADRHVLRRALAGLSEEHCVLVVMHDVEGWSMREISGELGFSTDVGYARLKSAHEQLRIQLSDGREDA